MKKLFFVPLCCYAMLLAAGPLSPGGVSIDFAQNKTASDKTGGESNMIAGANMKTAEDLKFWRKHNWLHIAPENGNFSELYARIQPYIHCEIKDGSAFISTDYAMTKILDNKNNPLTVANRLEYDLRLEGKKKYRLTFELSGELDKSLKSGAFYLFIFFSDSGRKNIPDSNISRNIALAIQPTRHSIEFVTTEKSAGATLVWAMYGPGTCRISHVAMTGENTSAVTTARLVPFYHLDNKFVLANQKPTPMMFGLRNESGAVCRQMNFFLRLPAGFTVAASRPDNPLTALPDNTWRVDVSAMQKRAPRNHYAVYDTVINLLVSGGGVAGKAGYWTEGDGVRTEVQTFDLEVMPSTISPRPRRFISGMHLLNDLFYDAAGTELLMPLLNIVGMNAVQCAPHEMAGVLKRHGFTVFAEAVANGYRIGPSPKTPEALFRTFDGKAYLAPGDTENICPVEVYAKGKYFRTQVVPFLERQLTAGHTDFIMANWEPFYFDNKGCFCERCRDEFIKFVHGKEAGEITAMWGKKSFPGKYQEKWVKFRSIQHAMLVGTLQETMFELGKKHGKESGFIPEIGYSALLTPGESRQYDVFDYLDKLPRLEPWGPYVYHSFSMPYQDFCGWNLITYFAGEKIRKTVAAKITAAKKRPDLIAFPHGYQGTDWVTEPETLGFEFLCFFVNGFSGAFGYLFPSGYDYRYWNAVAAANRLIAAHEDTVMDGEDISGSVKIVPLTPLPKPNLPVSTVSWNDYSAMPEAKNATLLQFRAFKHGERRLICTGNFWKKGECFYRMAIAGLPGTTKFAVFDPVNRHYFGTFSGTDLQKGIQLHVGAMRWNFAVVEPANAGKIYGEQITPEDMNACRMARNSAINNEFAREKAVSDAKFNPVNDYTLQRPLSSFDVTSQPVKIAGQNMIAVKTPHYSLLLDPENGGRICQWQSKRGSSYASGGNSFGIGVDSFVSPGIRQMDKTWQISGASIDADGIIYTLQFRIPSVGEPMFGGIRMIKKIAFKPDSIIIETSISNDGGEKRKFAYRSHNMTDFLRTASAARRGSVTSGQLKLAHDSGKTHIFALPSAPIAAKWREVYYNSVCHQTPVGELKFSAPWHEETLSAFFSPEKLTFIAFWHGDTMSTEAIYDNIVLSPGETVKIRAAWQINH